MQFRTRILTTTVLAAGAAASVATSRIGWDLESKSVTVPTAVLDAPAAAVEYSVRAEFRSPRPIDSPYGGLRIELFPTLTRVEGAVLPTVLVALVNDDSGTVVQRKLDLAVLAPDAPAPLYLSDDEIWQGCSSSCEINYTLRITREDLESPLPPVPLTITGNASVSLSEDGENQPPARTEVTLTVEPIAGDP